MTTAAPKRKSFQRRLRRLRLDRVSSRRRHNRVVVHRARGDDCASARVGDHEGVCSDFSRVIACRLCGSGRAIRESRRAREIRGGTSCVLIQRRNVSSSNGAKGWNPCCSIRSSQDKVGCLAGIGVDGIAHRAAIDAGGKTMAILANGVDIIYPATHRDLAKDILATDGAIISEYEPGVEARDFQFLERNRIVSGLSDAVIVTEAAARSGTLSTVMHALEQGREVFVVPGNITSPLSAGCNNLIKQGAHPITCAEDVLEIIAPDLLRPQTLLPLGATPLESKIIGLLQSGVRDGDELQTLSGVDASEFSRAITMMEISGTIRALGGNQWTLR